MCTHCHATRPKNPSDHTHLTEVVSSRPGILSVWKWRVTKLIILLFNVVKFWRPLYEVLIIKQRDLCQYF